MAFERFIKTKHRGIPSVSIWERGQMSFSRSAIVEFNIKDFSHIVFFYDKDTCRIGMVLSNEIEEGSCTIKKYGSCCTVSATAFIRCHKIPSVKKRPLNLDNKSGMLIA